MLSHRFHIKSSRFFCAGGAQDLDHPVLITLSKKYMGKIIKKSAYIFTYLYNVRLELTNMKTEFSKLGSRLRIQNSRFKINLEILKCV